MNVPYSPNQINLRGIPVTAHVPRAAFQAPEGSRHALRGTFDHGKTLRHQLPCHLDCGGRQEGAEVEVIFRMALRTHE